MGTCVYMERWEPTIPVALAEFEIGTCLKDRALVYRDLRLNMLSVLKNFGRIFTIGMFAVTSRVSRKRGWLAKTVGSEGKYT